MLRRLSASAASTSWIADLAWARSSLKVGTSVTLPRAIDVLEHRRLGAVGVTCPDCIKNAFVLDNRRGADVHRVVPVIEAVKAQVRAQPAQCVAQQGVA